MLNSLYYFIWRIATFLLAKLIGLLDYFVLKDQDQWIFALAQEQHWSGNLRQIYLAAQKNPQRKCLILAGPRISREWISHYHAIPARSWQGLRCILRAKVILFQYQRADFYWWGIKPRRRLLIHLWHGSPLKGLFFSSPAAYTPFQLANCRADGRACSLLITASHLERLALSLSLAVPFDRVAVTGLPRNDLLFMRSEDLPEDLSALENQLLKKLKGRDLILYAPTFRNQSDGVYAFSQSERDELLRLLEQHNLCLGIRGHINRRSELHLDDHDAIISLGADEFPETQVLLRQTRILITDYSGIWLDFILLDRPVIAFCYDWDFYGRDRGLLYDYQQVFPGNITYDFAALLNVLTQALNDKKYPTDRYQWIKRQFQSQADGNSTQRVLRLIEQKLVDLNH